MNLRGSYRALRNNSKAALLAAIEIYNKPQIEYREQCFSILLVNAWELLIKSILSMNQQCIYYPKARNEPYQTLSIQDALAQARRYFPANIAYEPLAQNLRLLVTYRNNSIHFYNQQGFGVIIYGLAQTSIINFRDLMYSGFGLDIANEMTVSLLPLSFGSQPDPIQFLQGTKTDTPKNKAVAQFLKEISETTRYLETQRQDTARFLTVFTISLQSVKKVSAADVVVGVKAAQDGAEPLIIERRIDPNISHPLRQKDVMDQIGPELMGIRFSPHTFQAIVWKYNIKDKPGLRWRSDTGGLTRYSREISTFMRKLTKDEILTAIQEYRAHLRSRRAHS